MKVTININADAVKVNPDGEYVMVTLQNIEVNELLAEFTPRQILSEMDFADVADYVADVKGAEKDYIDEV